MCDREYVCLCVGVCVGESLSEREKVCVGECM